MYKANGKQKISYKEREQMEGLIPYVYKAITQYRNAGGGTSTIWLNESPSASYTRLPGDVDFSPPPSADASTVLQPPTKHHFTNSCRAIK